MTHYIIRGNPELVIACHWRHQPTLHSTTTVITTITRCFQPIHQVLNLVWCIRQIVSSAVQISNARTTANVSPRIQNSTIRRLLMLNSAKPELSRECLLLKCLPKPSFADMSCVAATCRRHVFGHVADTRKCRVG